MLRVLILGAGGHAQVVSDILAQARATEERYCPAGFLDDDPHLVGTELMGLPVLGSLDCLYQFDYDAVVVAIGDNQTRARIFAAMKARGVRIVSAVHPTAILAPDVCIGEGAMICAGVVVNPGVVIGANVILNTACSVDHHSHIDAHAHVAPGTHLGGHVHVGQGAFIGIGTSIIPGRSIGEWAVVGAGSVVIQDVPASTTVVGVPARVIKQHTCK